MRRRGDEHLGIAANLRERDGALQDLRGIRKMPSSVSTKPRCASVIPYGLNLR